MTEAPAMIEHWLPPGVTPAPVQLSIVVPALNEKITISEFVEWCQEGIRRAGVTAQILIVDSSTDETPHLALAHGAEVLRVPPRGLGRAYIDALPYIRGDWVIMGDADLTYDFRELAPFVDKFRAGYEMVMGSRFKGEIENGAMPSLHRYFGTPLTTWFLNRLYGSHFSDIHCGMRGLTRPALLRLKLRSQAWEYASEMVLKAARLGLRITEVPVRFYRDRAGRLSHHRRTGWLSPWIAGWQNLRVMLVYSPDSFLLKPGIAMLTFGLLLSIPLGFGPITIGGIGFNLYWMLLGMTLVSLGYSCIQIGILARIMHDLRLGVAAAVQRGLTYNRGMIAAGVCLAVGLMLESALIWRYIEGGLKLAQLSYPAILGLMLIIVGFQTFGFTLLLEMTPGGTRGTTHEHPLK